MSKRFVVSLILGLCLAFPPTSLQAQVAPSQSQAAAYTGLHAAAHTGNIAELKKLIADGADINATESYGRTALMIAAHARNMEATAILMDAGANSDLLERDRYDALTIAAVDGNGPLVKLLIEKGAKTNLVTSVYDGTALIAAAHLGHVEVVQALIAGGAPLDHVNNLNWTALIESIVLGDGGKNHTQVLRDLVEAGADVNIPDGNGRSPLALAQARGYKSMIEILVAAGAK